MALQKSRFFDSVGDDRVYQSEDYAEYFRSFLSDGVFNGGNNLRVSATGSGMSVAVNYGQAWIQGYLYQNVSDGGGMTQLTIAAADAQRRIDRIVVRLDRSIQVRLIDLRVLKGTPAASPSPPALTRNSNIHEISLAQIDVKTGALKIESADITDERLNSAVCGFVNSLITLGTDAFAQDIANFWATISTQGYLPVTGKAADSNKLNGQLASYYATASHDHNASAINAGVLAIARIPTGTGSSQVALGNHTHASLYAALEHTHTIANVTGLQAALDGKAASNHTHASLYAALEHTHPIANVTDLQAALDGKAASSHTHSYAAVSHTHTIANVTGLQAALDGKAASSHTHTIANVTGLQAALDAKSATSHTHTGAQVRVQYGTTVPASLQPGEIFVKI